MATLKDAEIKVRIPKAMKAAVARIANDRLSSEGAIVREALLAYLETHGSPGKPSTAPVAYPARPNSRQT